MPFTNDEPTTHASLSSEQESLKQIRVPKIETGKLERMSLQDLHGIVAAEVTGFARENPQQAELIRRVAASTLGPLLQDPRLIGRDAPSVRDAEINAKIQHDLVHNIVYASALAKSGDYIESMYALVDALQRLSTSTVVKNPNLAAWWNGVRGELGLVKTLQAAGYRVYIPDYSAEGNETLKMDVQGGIDLVAIPPANSQRNEVYAIDAKSNTKLNRPVSSSPVTEMPLRKLQSLDVQVRNFLVGRTMRKVYQTTIFVQTLPQYQSDLDTEEADHKRALYFFGELNPATQRSIITSLAEKKEIR